MNERFYVLKALGGTFSDHYADAFPFDDGHHRGEPLSCPACGSNMSGYRWLPPHEIELVDFARFGDYAASPSWVDGFWSERLVNLFAEEALRGLATVHPPARIVRIRARGKMYAPPPTYHLVEFDRFGGDIDDEASAMRRENVLCSLCRSGVIKGYDRLVLKRGTWNGSDVFHAQSEWASILVSQRFVDMCFRYSITNVQFAPAEYFSWVDLGGTRLTPPAEWLIPVPRPGKRTV